ncbi:hypothetical protein Tco_0824435 [Tanacetum coccineum]|uniref:Uncharacterized protein n=1 Tax=Tanacetum coccineum TaxID=301880 RepID=A0ABQ5ALS5_9ASTR
MVKCLTGKLLNMAIWYDEDIHSLRSIETEFPAIVFNDRLTSEDALSCEPTVSSLNDNENDFRISFDESDDEDYTVIFDKNSFSYKIILANDLKTDSENDNEKVNMPLFPSPESTVSCIDDLDFFKEFENKFPVIVYNDALTSKSNFLTEPTLSPHHIDKFDLKDETSLSEHDEEEQNILYFNDLFPFNIIYPDMALPPLDQMHQYLRFEGLQYTDADIVDFEKRLARIYMREVHRVQVFDFGGLPDLMAKGLSGSMLMEYRDAQGQKEIDIVGFGAYWAESARQIPDKGDLSAYWIGISYAGDFLGTAPSYTLIRDPMLRLCHRLIACSIAGRSQAPKKVTVTDLFYLRGMDVDSVNVPYPLARYLRLFALGRKHGAMISGAAEDVPAVDEGAQADPAPVQAPQQPPPPLAAGRTIP